MNKSLMYFGLLVSSSLVIFNLGSIMYFFILGVAQL